jgi:hypothetical protein
VGSPRHISTSYAERQNLSLRMASRRFTRLTNGFSKRADYHLAAVGLFVAHFNFCRVNETLRVTPAMAAGLSQTVMDWSDLIEAMDADTPAKKRGPYKKASVENSN